MISKKYQWHKVTDGEDGIEASENKISVIQVGNKKICLTKYQEQWFGFSYTCPHAGGILAGGYIDKNGNVACPLHGYKFSLKNGRNTSGEGFYMTTFPVEIRPDGVYVGIEES